MAPAERKCGICFGPATLHLEERQMAEGHFVVKVLPATFDHGAVLTYRCAACRRSFTTFSRLKKVRMSAAIVLFGVGAAFWFWLGMSAHGVATDVTLQSVCYGVPLGALSCWQLVSLTAALAREAAHPPV